MTSKVFEEKTARDKAMAYDGNPDNGATWRSDVYDYFVSKWPDCEPWLSWAEEQGATAITPGAIDDHKRSGVAMTEIDPYVFNHHVWGFLQHCLSGPARQTFKAAKRQDGMNVWRQLVLKINSKTECRQLTLRNRCQTQAQVTDERHVDQAIADWEQIYSQYLDAGGTEMCFGDRRGQLLRILPNSMRKEVFKNMQTLKSIDEIKEWMRIQMELEEQWQAVDGGARRRGPPVNNLETEGNGDEDSNASSGPTADDMEALMALGEEASVTDILALQQRFKKFGTGGRPWKPRGPEARSQQRAGAAGGRGDQLPGAGQAYESKCVNCGKPGHKAAACPEPRCEDNKRPCFNCNKLGHLARDCMGRRTGWSGCGGQGRRHVSLRMHRG